MRQLRAPLVTGMPVAISNGFIAASAVANRCIAGHDHPKLRLVK